MLVICLPAVDAAAAAPAAAAAAAAAAAGTTADGTAGTTATATAGTATTATAALPYIIAQQPVELARVDGTALDALHDGFRLYDAFTALTDDDVTCLLERCLQLNLVALTNSKDNRYYSVQFVDLKEVLKQGGRAAAVVQHVLHRVSVLATELQLECSNLYLLIRGQGDCMHFHADAKDSFVYRVSARVGDGAITYRVRSASVTVPLSSNCAYVMNGAAAGKDGSGIKHGAHKKTTPGWGVVFVADLTLPPAATAAARQLDAWSSLADLPSLPAALPLPLEINNRTAAGGIQFDSSRVNREASASKAARRRGATLHLPGGAVRRDMDVFSTKGEQCVTLLRTLTFAVHAVSVLSIMRLRFDASSMRLSSLSIV
jgi:hypothetical protein